MHCLVTAHPAFADVPLSYLALPGAENAGTFNLDPEAFDTQAGSACTTISAGSSVSGTTAQRFSATQDETITRQLDQGVRWIDLHVGYNGGGNPITGWRVVQNLYSNWPLSEYLDQVANWAAQNPTEAVVVDLSSICYDHDTTAAVDRGLWANFAAKSAEGAGPKTIANVAARAASLGGSLASVTLSQLARPGHNVAVVLPSDAKDLGALSKTDHVEPFRSANPDNATRRTTVVVQSDPRVAPTSPTQFPAANISLESFPKTAKPALGSLRGKGLYVGKLAYELASAPASTQDSIFSAFVGLIASEGIFRAWMSGLWTGAYGQILSMWGDSSNVVLADAVDHGDFVPAVIESDGR